MAWVETVPEIEIKQEREVVTVHGEKILLFYHEDKLYAVEAACPHMKLPLTKGKVCDGALVCPWHKSAFDLATGNVKDWSPWPPLIGKMLGKISKEKTLKIYETKIENGEIFVKMPDWSKEHEA